jgi:hypothetical protein
VLPAFCAPIGAKSSCSSAKSSRRELAPATRSFGGTSIDWSLIRVRAKKKASRGPARRPSRTAQPDARRRSDDYLEPCPSKGLVKGGRRKTQNAAGRQRSARARFPVNVYGQAISSQSGRVQMPTWRSLPMKGGSSKIWSLERSVTILTDNEQWLSNNHDKMVHAPALPIAASSPPPTHTS